MQKNKIDVNIINLASCNVFKKVKLTFIRPELNQVSNVDRSEEFKFLTRIRLGLNHSADYKFRHNFQDSANPIYIFGQEIL